MKKKFLLLCLLVLLSLGFGKSLSLDSRAISGDAIRGGQLYDNWMLVLDQRPPQGDQPLWDNQSTNPHSGRVTWRCKECHSWDYKGGEGVYGPEALFYTGFPSLSTSVGSSEEAVIAWMDGSINPEHDFLSLMNSKAVEDLAAFILTMQVDTDLIIDANTGEGLGNEDRGLPLYLDTCAECHGSAGNRIDFAPGGSPQYLGDIAAIDPWRALHKIRFGIPGSNMPSAEAEGWSLQEISDLLAYIQGLPRGNPNFAIFKSDAGLANAEAQGDIEPVIWAAVLIMTIIGVGLTWERINSASARS